MPGDGTSHRACLAVAGAVGLAAATVAWRRTNTVSWRPSAGALVDGPLPANVVGDGPLRVVLLHGMFNSGRYWGEAYDALADPGRTVASDLLGFGRAPRPPTGYSADDHADAVADTLHHLGATGPAVVAGTAAAHWSPFSLRSAIPRS